MSISYPLALPTTSVPRSVSFKAQSKVGYQSSPFTGEQTVYAHQGEWFEAQVDLPAMQRANADYWISFLLALNGMEGTFLMGDPAGANPRGSWSAGSPQIGVNGAHAAGVKTVGLCGLLNGATGKAGDWIQFGSGSGAQLHKLVQDFTATASGNVSIEIWPRTKNALSNLDVPVVNSAVGLWRLSSNEREWSIEEAQMYGISFGAVQAF